MERRTNLRLKKNLVSTIISDNREYPSTVIDISAEGIAFETSINAPLAIGDRVIITLADEYKTIYEDNNLYIGHLNGCIKNITPTNTDGVIRVGCRVSDKEYNEYVQEQYISYACGVR